VQWRVPLKGRGQSSPIIWGERIFLTTAVDDGRQRVVICRDRNDGRLLWEHVVWTGEPEASHTMNGWASASCATDGEQVYAFFGRGGGLHCFTVEGEPVWQRDLGQFVMDADWGTAASPVLVDGLVIQNCDADEDAHLIALDKRTGEEVWRTPRENYRGWSTPVLIDTGGRRELVLNGHTGVRAYDPATGKELWYCQGFNGRGSPTVTPADGLLHVVNGLSGDTYAIRPGGEGDVTSSHMVWHAPRKGRDLSSPIVVNGTVIISGLRAAIITAYDAQDGRELWKERVGGQISASPVSWSGKAFFVSESGETLVIDPGASRPIVARNTVESEPGELFRSSITPSDGQVFLRSDRALYCISQRTSAAD
jgi:outer membrane protein assembly factor BamB